MNELMHKVQEALERDLAPKARGHVFSKADYLRAQKVIDAAIEKAIGDRASILVERHKERISYERLQFQKKYDALQAEYDWLLPYAQAKQRIAEKRAKIGDAARTSFNMP